MTPFNRKTLDDYLEECRANDRLTFREASLAIAIRAVLNEIDTLNPPMPIDEYPAEQRRKFAHELQADLMHPKSTPKENRA